MKVIQGLWPFISWTAFCRYRRYRHYEMGSPGVASSDGKTYATKSSLSNVENSASVIRCELVLS